MATLAEHPVIGQTSYDQDIDSFLNLDQLSYTSSDPIRSKTTLTTQPSLPSSDFTTTADVRSASFAASSQSPIAFQAPSHQYDEHKQQTGLPPGALAQAMTFNTMNTMGFNAASPGFAMSGEVFHGQLKREDAPMDFNAAPTRNPSEMDLESDNNMGAVPAYFFAQNPSKSQFVDPNALGGHEAMAAGPSTQVGRMYPGMHQQQAAMAKAAQQQKHHEMLRQQQQQQQQQQQRRVEEQMQQSGTPQPQPQPLRTANPAVDERISRLLQQMRQNAMGSPDQTPSPSALPQMTKAKKDEQDMDEDERLLASEEGKKLSSKERRQLRNKVSARAFRSRRKEYIGQLESEVAARTNEAHELRMQNRALFEENARLTDLARMLLSSPQFSQFLDETNVSGLPVPSQAQPQPQLQSQAQPQPQPPAISQPPMQQPTLPKDPNTAHSAQEFPMQQAPQVPMMMVPNQGLDVSTMNVNNAGWNSGIDMNYGNAPVFAVLEVPEPPAIDIEFLSGKSAQLGGTYAADMASTKDEAPSLDLSPITTLPKAQSATGSENLDVEFDESDPAFALFADQPVTHSVRETTEISVVDIQSEKPSAFELVVENDSSAGPSRTSPAAKLASSQLHGRLINKAFRTIPFSSFPHSRLFTCSSHRNYRSKDKDEEKYKAYKAYEARKLFEEHKESFEGSVGQKENGELILDGYRERGRGRAFNHNKAKALNPPKKPRLRTQFVHRTLLVPNSYVYRVPRLDNSRGKNYILLDPRRTKKLSGPDFPRDPQNQKHPMKFNYQILTTPTADTPGTTVLLHFPDKRYFFGQIVEGTQRACTENGTRLTNVTDVFLSGRMKWGNTGGLIGVILTQADGLASSSNALEIAAREKEARRQRHLERNPQSKQSTSENKSQHGAVDTAQDSHPPTQRGTLTIHGGRNLAHTLATARRFVFRKGMPVFTREYDSESLSKRIRMGEEDPFEQPTWSDSNIKVWAMPVVPFSFESEPTPESRVRPRSRSRSPSRPRSPRKRSLDEFREVAPKSSEVDTQAVDQVVRQSVVADMFNSTWSLDALTETRLADVKMPAVMFVRDPETKDLVRYQGPAPGSGEPLPDITVLVRKPWPGASVEKIPLTSPNNEALSYVIRNHDLRGAFDPAKARALKVVPGKDYGRLANGEEVISEDKKVVTPEMVLGPPRLGKGLAIIDLPAGRYVKALFDRPEWKSPSVTTNLGAFLWILGPGVANHPAIRAFVQDRPDCKHIISSPDYCPNYLSMKSIAELSLRMAQLRPDNFSVPVHDNLTLVQRQGDPMKRTDIFEFAEPGLLVEMTPEFQLNDSEKVPRLNTAALLQQIPLSVQQRASAITKRLGKRKAQRNLKSFLKNLPGQDVEIFTLGTGSSSPSKYRNVSSTLVHVPDQGYYLLDCGENTLGQLKRVFEPEKLREVLQNLRMIWISHLHADHHLGTVSVINAWYRENYPHGIPRQESNPPEIKMSKILQEKRLFLVSEQMMVEWLEEYAGVEKFGFSGLVPLTACPNLEADGSIKTKFYYRHCRADGSYPGRDLESGKPVTTELSFTDESSPLTSLLQKATGLSDLLTTKVSHCRGAMAMSMVFPDSFKLSFSGDCRPSSAFATIGKGSTVLIHEATFQDDMVGSAIAKKHSTTSEAIDVGRKMRARSILLTHFSQRYQKLAYVDQKNAPKSQGRDGARPAGMEGTTDIPVDEPEEELSVDGPMALDSDAQGSEGEIPSVVPVVTAFDYMRARVGDMFTIEAYSPAVEKLHKVIERAAELKAEKQRQAREAEAQNKGKKGKKQAKQANQVTQDLRESSPSTIVHAKAVKPAFPPMAPRDVSIWSASESESGWTTSGDESDGGHRA